jgi:CBS domain-containing protein
VSAVHVSVILGRKGSDVFTIAPDATVSQAAAVMAEHNVGALVVSVDGRTPGGVVSERDVVREIARVGAACLDHPVALVMSAEPETCAPHAAVHEVMAIMTERRIRHLPVVANGELAGMVSIGDVVKWRLHELEVEAKALQEYVTGPRA